MKKHQSISDRRNFLKKSTTLGLGTAGILGIPAFGFSKSPNYPQRDEINIVGPKEGFTPQIGTMVSMMNWMRNQILHPLKGLTVKQLDYLHDENSNSIGAMLWHLAATEKFYQIHTFEGVNWGEWSEVDDKEWSVPMGLGNNGRKQIKGHDLEFYLKKLSTIREYTLQEFAKRDDDWLLAVDEDWFWGPTNNYCKWFHVCEHESNHNGQIKWLKSRLPS